MPVYCLAILLVGWLVWTLPFFVSRRNTAAPQKVDRRARWGILIVTLSYSVLWFGTYWIRHTPRPWRVALSIAFFAVGAMLSWGARSALGRQWRIEAGLNPDHELVTSGPYRLVRHPIYASMLCMFLGTGFMITPIPRFVVALVLFIVGTEIRVRVEDGLLASRFGEGFREYQRSVSAYVPLVH